MGMYSDLHFDNGTYVPQYAGAPLEEIKDTAKELSTRHYSSLANASQLQILANQMKASLLPGAKSHVDTHIQALDQALQEIATQGGENYTPKLNALATALQSDQGILNAGQRAKEYHEQTALIDKLKSEGHIPLYDEKRRADLENAAPDSDLYKTPYEAQVEPYKDPNPEMQAIWNQVKPDSYEGRIHAAPGTKASELLGKAFAETDEKKALPLFFEAITSGGITEKKITDDLLSAWTGYKNTASFKQQTGKLVGKSEEQVKNEFLKSGLLNVFTNLKREYRPLPAGILRPDSTKKTPIPVSATFAPGTVLETNRKYNSQGEEPVTSFVNKGLNAAAQTARADQGDSAKPGEKPINFVGTGEKHPQFVANLKAAAEITGQSNPDPNSPEAASLVKSYDDLTTKRVSNAWLNPYSEDEARELSGRLQREYSLVKYMDENGNIFTSADPKFADVTGGDYTKFEIQAEYDPKNHLADQANDENFIKARRVVAVDKGVSKTFFMSQLPGAFHTTPEEVNTNVVYSKTNVNPGQEVDLGHGVKAKAIVGKQLEGEDIGTASYPIKASIPGYHGGKTFIYDSPEHLAKTLADSVGIKLPLK